MSIYAAVATSAGRDTRAVSSDGKLDVKLGLQEELGGEGSGTNPEQLFAAGYAACFATSMHLVAGRQKLDTVGGRSPPRSACHPTPRAASSSIPRSG